MLVFSLPDLSVKLVVRMGVAGVGEGKKEVLSLQEVPVPAPGASLSGHSPHP